MRFFEALSWIKNMDLQGVIVEGGVKVIVDDILSNTHSASVYGDFVDGCHAILAFNSSFYVAFVKRDANFLAHKLARVS